MLLDHYYLFISYPTTMQIESKYFSHLPNTEPFPSFIKGPLEDRLSFFRQLACGVALESHPQYHAFENP